MLNLDRRNLISFSTTHLRYLNGIKPFHKDQWNITINAMKSVKEKIKQDLILIQNNQCAYCMKDLDDRTRTSDDLQLDGDREHIAPKSIHPEFMFEELNLVLACSVCNRTLKNDIDVISRKRADYSLCDFNIVHPYLNNYKDHIEFDSDMIVCEGHITLKGFKTISIFKLDEPYLTKERAKLYAHNNKASLEKENEDLKKEVAYYKAKAK
jgi:hypothetical protein